MISRAGRRLARVRVADEILAELMTQGYEVERLKCVEGLPPGALLIGSYPDGAKQSTYLIFAHESFAPVLPGHEAPEIHVSIQVNRAPGEKAP